ncbi:MAG: UDP-N-acetylmuramate dehydrogenase [bacterium]|nr:MAG: UDP-N-acetylmuramate dehydrogenase [bacterium]
MLKIHLMGVSGSGMSGVYDLALKNGYQVTGCDLKTTGHSQKHLEGIDLLVVSPAVLYQSKKHPELVEAQKKGIVLTWEEFVGTYLSKDKIVIAVAGTHGKSTTTAFVGKLLEDSGFDPTVLLGATVPEWGGNSRFGKGKYFVIEADEFNDNFLNYKPDIIILNNVEFDHPDYFKDEKHIQDSFNKFIQNLKKGGKLISEIDSLDKKFNLQVMGEHNQKNANMAYLLGKTLGINDQDIIKSIESFKGIGRRMEQISDHVFDDYAHHPTAIKTTLEGLREKYPNKQSLPLRGKKILAVVEPHGYKRTKTLLSLYKNVFDAVDGVVVGPIFKARDKVDSSISPNDIVNISGHKNIKSIDDLNWNSVVDGYDVIVVMGAGDSNHWAKEISKIVDGVSFRDLTTLKVGGKVKHYFEVKNKEELRERIKFAKKNNLEIFILGGGSDIAVSDKSFEGVVIKYTGENVTYDGNTVTAEAGLGWDNLVEETVLKNLSGIECLSGIPGTVGGSPIQNIGAYGQELSDTFESLTAYDLEKEEFVTFNKKDCKFGYRESIFKTKEYWQKFVITDITLKLSKYEDKDLEILTIRNEILRVRSEKLEDPNVVPNAGSFFKNPIVDLETKTRLEKEFSDIKIYDYTAQGGSTLSGKVFAGYLIEKAGWKGKSLGPVKVSDKHALILTNPEGKGTFKDIKKLADAITNDVKDKFGITLEPEVQYINI